MKNIFKESQDLITCFLEALIPEDSRLKKELGKKAKLHRDTVSRLKVRNSLSADTLFRLCLAQGIPPAAIKSILKKKKDNISKGMVEWIKFGSKLSEKDIEILLGLLKDFKKHYALKK